MLWAGLAILAQAFASAANFTDKLVLEKYIKDTATVFIFSGFMSFLVGLAVFVIRGFPILPGVQILVALAAGICLQMYLLPYFKALDTDDASLVVVLFQLIPVFSLILSAVFLGERLLGNQLVGSGVILLSGILVSIKMGEKAKINKKAFGLMLVSSLIFAISTVLFKFVVDLQNLWDSLAYEGLGMGLGVLLALCYPGFYRRVKKEVEGLKIGGWGSLSLSESFYIVYRVLFAAAISLGSVTLVNVMGGFQPVFLVLFGWILTKHFPKLISEDISYKTMSRKLLAVAGVFVGLYLIFL